MIIKKEMTFQQPMDRVWDLLTNPKMTRQYMFGSAVLTDWEVGSPVLWEGQTEDGQKIVYVKGQVLEIEPKKKVTINMFDPNVGMADIPANYVNLCYELFELEEGTRFVLTQGDFSKAENGQQRYEESLKGWDMVLQAMKQVINSQN